MKTLKDFFTLHKKTFSEDLTHHCNWQFRNVDVTLGLVSSPCNSATRSLQELFKTVY